MGRRKSNDARLIISLIVAFFAVTAAAIYGVIKLIQFLIRIGATAAANSKEKQINRTINADLDFSKAKSLIDQVLSLETFSDVLQWDREASELVEHLLKRKGVWAQKFIEEAPVQ